MNEPKRRAARHSLTGTGLYIALFLGVTALAVAGYWTLLPKNTTDKDAENVSSQVELPVQDETPQMPEAELPQPARAPVSMSAASSMDTLFFMIVFSFVIRSLFQYGNSLQKLCKIQKRSFVKHM